MASFSINSKAYQVAGDLTPMNIAKAVHRDEGDRVSVGALAEKLRIATGSHGVDNLVTHMSSVDFGPRDFVRLFGSAQRDVGPALRTPERLTDRVTGDAHMAPPVPMDLEHTLHGLEDEPAVAANLPKRGAAKVVTGSSELGKSENSSK